MSEQELEALKRHPRVFDLYASRIRLAKGTNNRFRASCPFHSDSSPSFDVYLQDGLWLYGCFGCGAKGNVLQFVQKMDGVDFRGAVKIARDFTSEWKQNAEKVEATFKPLGQEEKKIARTYSLSEYVGMESALRNNPNAKDYLESRGIDCGTAKRMHLGYRQDVGRLAGDSNSDIANQGWLVFPTLRGEQVTSLKYRSIVRKAFCKQPGMKTELFNSGTVDMLEPVFLVEGEFDAAVLEQAGFKAVSLPNATYQPTPEDKDLVLSAECVILAGDNDEAGQKSMQKLWAEMKERTYLLQWPSGIKDANAFWDASGRDLSVFRTKIDGLVQEAKSRPMAGIYSLQESLMNNTEENIKDDPNRFRFSLPSVDQMAILSPGAVIGIVATNTGMGKTTFVLQETLEAARRHGEVVLNYQAELSIEQVTRIVTAHTLRKHRLELSNADMKSAAHALAGVKYYIGRNPALNTITPVLDLIEAAVRRLSPTVVVLDNLHFLCRFEQDQVKAVENAMQRIKNLAAQYRLKFFVVGQPKKSEATAKGKMLHVTDVRGSVSFGDDSDAVFTIHRDMLTNSEDKKNDYSPVTKIRLVKVRDKGPGDAEVELYFLGEIATFSDVARQDSSGVLAFGNQP